jgi:hypothetical protein
MQEYDWKSFFQRLHFVGRQLSQSVVFSGEGRILSMFLDLKLQKKKWCRRRALVFVFDEMNSRVCVSCNLFLTRRRRTREKKVSSLIIQQQFPFLCVFERETDFQRFWT